MLDPVGASDITFHLNERTDLQEGKMKLWERDNDELKEVADFWWPEQAIEDVAGSCMYTTSQSF